MASDGCKSLQLQCQLKDTKPTVPLKKAWRDLLTFLMRSLVGFFNTWNIWKVSAEVLSTYGDATFSLFAHTHSPTFLNFPWTRIIYEESICSSTCIRYATQITPCDFTSLMVSIHTKKLTFLFFTHACTYTREGGQRM